MKDSLPYVGEMAEYPNALFSLSYGANGVIFALLAAEIIRDAITGRKNPDAHIFRFGR